MKKKYILILFLLIRICLQGFSQESGLEVSGRILDDRGNPVPGALVSVTDGRWSSTDKEGKFNIQAQKEDNLTISAPDLSKKTVKIEINKPMIIVMDHSSRPVNIGYALPQTLEEATASVASVSSEDLMKRPAKDISNTLFGNILGLTTLEGNGDYAGYEPTFYVRGLQSLSGSSPLVLVDGIERDASYVTPEEVENVTVLKDAAAVALYGYKGANGAINIVTKRGKYNTNEVKFSVDHSIDWQERLPKFVDAATYASSINEALSNDGKSAKYSDVEINAFKTGKYPYLYPNVNWIDETFRNTGITDLYNLSFRGGKKLFRYYTLTNLQVNTGFVAHPAENSGYSTQFKYSKANVRTNLDIDLTPTTKIAANIMGTLMESSRPGSSANLWGMIYTLPSAVFPIKSVDGLWGGNATWAGTSNPVAESEDAGYTKYHLRTINTDLSLRQDLSSVLPGLGGGFKLSYDNLSQIAEDHSKTFFYGSDAVTQWTNDEPTTTTHYQAGTASPLGTSATVTNWERAFNFAIDADYNRILGNHKIYSQFKWDYEYRNINGVNETFYRQNTSWYTHYGYKERYYADLSLVVSGSNLLAPGHKWSFSPTISAAWVLSKENFLKKISFVDFLKLRASFGIINKDYVPTVDYWDQIYTGGSLYNFDTGYTSSLGSWTLGTLATLNATHEKAYKYNIGADASLFKGLNLTLEGFYQRRSDIFVSSSGKYSSVLGFTAPYENDGIVDSWGTEVGIDYFKKIGNFSFTAGTNFSLNKSKIVNEDEEPQPYSNLKATGRPLNQIFGLIAVGLFKDQNDINNSPTQTFGTVVPGDIKYKDVNGDGKIDANDVTAIGYNTLCPEIYYSFHLGMEWNGIGADAQFQGTGHYSAILNTTSLYWPVLNTTTISQYYYDNRWTKNNPNAKFPRLSSQISANNYRTNTIWLVDRSFLKLRDVELYYKFPASLLKCTSFMSNAKLYVKGVDLVCFDHIKIADPEDYGATTPLTRSAVVGLSIDF